jgi:phosphoribosyl 1,2-cyclic phosphodiesterase
VFFDIAWRISREILLAAVYLFFIIGRQNRRQSQLGELAIEDGFLLRHCPSGAFCMPSRSTQASSGYEDAMRLRMWGVRGGIATPGVETVRYGGNTACVELRCGPHLLILDAGTGLRNLGQKLAANPDPVAADLLISHTHLDHICGLPFFQPHFDPSARLRIWGGHLPRGDALAQAFAASWSPPLMPDLSGAFRASVSYESFTAGDSFTPHPGLTVRTAPLRHPGGATGYRIDWAGRSIAYVTDTEHPAQGIDAVVAGLIDGADLMVYDSSYTDAEYAAHVGWGHSSWQAAIKLADAAGAGKLVLFHHDPSHNDDFLDAIAEAAGKRRPGTEVAREQAEFVLSKAVCRGREAIPGVGFLSPLTLL